MTDRQGAMTDRQGVMTDRQGAMTDRQGVPTAWPTCYCLAYMLLPGLPATAWPTCYCLAYLLLPPPLLLPDLPVACAWSLVPRRRGCPGCGWTHESSSDPAAHTDRNLQDGREGLQRVKGPAAHTARNLQKIHQ